METLKLNLCLTCQSNIGVCVHHTTFKDHEEGREVCEDYQYNENPAWGFVECPKCGESLTTYDRYGIFCNYPSCDFSQNYKEPDTKQGLINKKADLKRELEIAKENVFDAQEAVIRAKENVKRIKIQIAKTSKKIKNIS